MTNSNQTMLVSDGVFEDQQILESEIKRISKAAKANNVLFGSGTKMLTESGETIAFYIGGRKEESRLFENIEKPYSPEGVLNIASHFRDQGATVFDDDLKDNVVPINYKGETFKVTSDKQIKPTTSKASSIVADEIRTLTLNTDDLERNIRISYLTFGENETLKALNKINDDNYLISQETLINKAKLEIPEKEKKVIEKAIDEMEDGVYYKNNIETRFDNTNEKESKKTSRPRMQ